MNLGHQVLKGIGKFSDAEAALLEQKLVLRTVARGELILREGEVCRTACFLLKGSAYQFTWEDVDERVTGLYVEGDWLLNYSSFVSQQASTSIIKAFTDLEIAELHMDHIHELVQQSPSFFRIGKVLDQAAIRLQHVDQSRSAAERHNQLFISRPDLFRQFPLKMIASYLNIAPETLSRIRALR